ncbi:unnamed protein product [Oikopleura dioica]|uniref:Uncharacterized protein n=1 Tax=Oikopleura dioica TaxID=34765 RepID=E4Y946_OIKDI|nr:unnamed protein product [Oikopleura dioica]
MKISPLLVTAVVGKPSEESIAPRFSVSRTMWAMWRVFYRRDRSRHPIAWLPRRVRKQSQLRLGF